MNGRMFASLVVGLVVGAIAGILGFTWFVGGSGEPSSTTTAPTLDANAIPTLNATQAFDAVTQVAQLNIQVVDLQATVGAFEAMAEVVEPTEVVVVEEPTATPVPEEASLGRVLYRIVAEESTVNFTMQEDLRGSRIDVIGTTNDVAGDVVIDFDTPSSSTVGTIRINARTLATDNEFRNRALRSRILLSSQDEFEFIEFVPTSVSGLPESIEIGEEYTFEVVGNLTIVGQTNEVTFTVTATVESEDRLVGSATTSVLYADWGISIPDAPGVANVSDDVTLTLAFVAEQVDE